VVGDACRVAEEAGAAICIEPEDADALASAILHLYEHPELASTLGARGRTYVEARYDYDHLTAMLNARIVALLNEQRNKTGRGKEPLYAKKDVI